MLDMPVRAVRVQHRAERLLLVVLLVALPVVLAASLVAVRAPAPELSAVVPCGTNLGSAFPAIDPRCR